MLKLATRFLKDENGAVTVDWVVLTAAVVGLNILMVVNLIEDGLVQNSEVIADKAANASGF